ncbi:UNVERIFIED_ORG: hypothetical protein QOE_1689 [Clostridioides difficile F501]
MDAYPNAPISQLIMGLAYAIRVRISILKLGRPCEIDNTYYVNLG